ncbi:hypothetical protein QUF70_09050 [Desulfobacterales bacterium HSG17]|nr:hypothetical protein [Desulfobacterales bacterium HSG17]
MKYLNEQGKYKCLYFNVETDLMLIWFYDNKVQKVVIELKILYKSLKKTVDEGLEQTWDYMDKCGTKQGHLVIF